MARRHPFNDATIMKSFIRLFAALFGTIFGSLVISVQSCTYASETNWPRWADFVCGHNVPHLWVVTAPLLFVLIWLVLSRHFKKYRHYVAVLLAVLYGLAGLLKFHDSPSVWMALFTAVSFAAAAGIALRSRWGSYLVYAQALLFSATWAYAVWIATTSGYFATLGIGKTTVSLLPGIAFLLLFSFACHVVTIRRIDGRNLPKLNGPDALS
jgi:hypothetical protein